jgi:uncharacterized phage protein (TIGR01671 family)
MTNRRTIKFRVWDKQKNWFYSEEYLKHFNVAVSWDGEIIYRNFICGEKEVGNEVIIQQWTGLVDKNRKEIYEGDIVSLEIPLNDQPILFNATIVWDYYQYAFEVHSSENTVLSIEDWFMLGDEPSVDCTVIGNIFES